ncbi:50S ribosomal protein L31e [Nitrosarchaeum koreense]|uniref:Large ribosomal subunit protein eL31 n=1 Tax=Nitrosarchaeum koreense MY1 TaxID=1001994 RepID=F9CZ28_9ARCH|nr:50S ribosomal protein L31e [Nitrosarchaeum koreense]EGP94186.1 Ribosomal protein L31e [Nitrosarchaeum koreense MY1]
MSQELERVYTINLGKVLLSVDTHRAPRAINMIKEFARHHMKTSEIKIEEDLAHIIWSKGVRSPPRKIRVRMSKTDEGYILVSPFTDEPETPAKEVKKETPKETPAKEVKKETPKETPAKEVKKETPAKEVKKETPSKEVKKETPAKEVKKETPAKKTVKKSK